MIDSADTRRMEETGVELSQLLDEERLADVPLLIMANKQDLMSALSPAEVSILSYSTCGHVVAYETTRC